jgi:hypothetical protein
MSLRRKDAIEDDVGASNPRGGVLQGSGSTANTGRRNSPTSARLERHLARVQCVLDPLGVDARNEFSTMQNRHSEVAMDPLMRWHVGLELIIKIE